MALSFIEKYPLKTEFGLVEIDRLCLKISDKLSISALAHSFSGKSVETGMAIDMYGGIMETNYIGNLLVLKLKNPLFYLELVEAMRKNKWDVQNFPIPEILFVEEI